VPASELDAINRRIRSNTAAFGARLEQLKAMTDSMSERWAPADRRPRSDERENIGWTPVPGADGIRQSA
jgi:hypothetical protein